MSTQKIDVAAAMSGLKDFQRRTVDYVFNRMYLDERPTRRFLVADEVGLGKTMVARGIIAKDGINKGCISYKNYRWSCKSCRALRSSRASITLISLWACWPCISLISLSTRCCRSRIDEDGEPDESFAPHRRPPIK